MTLEDRIERLDTKATRIDTQLELLARYSTQTANRLDELTDIVKELAKMQTQTSADITRILQILDRHLSDGHGGN